MRTESREPVLATSHAVLAERARSFFWASLLLPPAMRDDAAVVYAFCRAVDDAVDAVSDRDLASAALARLEAEVTGRTAAGPLAAAFLGVARRRELPVESALELIAGARSDLGPVLIEDDATLLRYCYRVAGTVGLMMCAILGVRRQEAFPHAVDLGIAMQLTNIVRDVAEDAALGRVYLPRVRLRAVGVEPEALLDRTADPRPVAVVVGEIIELAETYYRSADGGMRYIPWRARQAILVASRIYRAIGLRLRRRGCDPLGERTMVPGPEKLLWGVRALVVGMGPRMLGLTGAEPHRFQLHRTLYGLAGTNPGRLRSALRREISSPAHPDAFTARGR